MGFKFIGSIFLFLGTMFVCGFLVTFGEGFLLGAKYAGGAFDTKWTACAKYREHCECQPPATCIVRFGMEEDWIFKQVQGWNIPCTHEAFGLETKRKESKEFACYTTTVPQNQTGGSYTTAAKSGQDFYVTRFTLVRFGIEKDDLWIYGLLANGSYTCGEDLLGFFPDGHELAQKVCQVGQHTAFPQNQTFEQPLAYPNQEFQLTNADAIYSVYIGTYIAQVAASTTLTCNAAEFGLNAGLLDRDPPPCGVLSGEPTEFYNPLGYWQNVETCEDTLTCSFQIGFGVTSTTTSSRSASWQLGLSATVQGGLSFTYKGAGGNLGGRLTPSVSYRIDLTQSKAYSVSLSEACSAGCSVPSGQTITLWQWQMSTSEINFAPSNLPLISDQFETFSCGYLCLPQGYFPQCPLGYCLDPNCQTCNGTIFE